jgi:hypothetical protein
MKTNRFKFMMALSWMLFATLLVVSSCKKDEETPPTTVIEDGLYVKGAGTALTGYDAKGLLTATPNEVDNSVRAGLVELYVAVKAGTDGFNIVEVVGGVPTVYGPGADFALVPLADRIGDEPKTVDFWRGSYTASATPFTVPTDGLYHVMLDKTLKKIAVVPVTWGVIGAATPGGWTNSTELPSKGFDLNSMTFEKTDLVMTKADFKFRYSDGWKIVLDTTVDLGGGKKGVRVNTNFGGTIAALVPGGANISNTTLGKYTVKMVWTLGTGHTATMTKTGDVEVIDYTNTSLGLVGNGLFVGGVQQTWDLTIMMSTPVVDNVTNYTWTWNNVDARTDGSFKIREGQDWSKKSIGYNDVTMAGLAADKFGTNTDGNFVPLENGVYDMVLKIDAVTETYTFTVNPAGAAPEMYMLGDGTLAGWVNTAALPMTGTNGVYSITSTLGGTGKFIKFITVLGQWQPQYGTDATGTSTGGPLFVNDGTGSDPASIPCPDAAGTYTIGVNTNTMTYTISAKK